MGAMTSQVWKRGSCPPAKDSQHPGLGPGPMAWPSSEGGPHLTFYSVAPIHLSHPLSPSLPRMPST